MGFRQPVPALDAGRCQRKARLAYPCGVGPAAHHPGEDAVRRRRTGVDLTNTVYALDSTTIAPACRSFRGRTSAPPRRRRRCTRCSTCGGNIPSFIHISDGKLHEVHALDMLLPASRSQNNLRRGSWLRRLCPPLCVAPSRGLLRHAGASRTSMPSRLFGADGSLDRHHLRPDHLPGRPSTRQSCRSLQSTAAGAARGLALRIHGVRITPNFCGASASRTPPSPATTLELHHAGQQILVALRPPPVCALVRDFWQVELFFKWKASSIRRSDQISSTARRRTCGEDGSGLPSRSTSSSPSSRSASTWTPRSTLCYRSSR